MEELDRIIKQMHEMRASTERLAQETLIQIEAIDDLPVQVLLKESLINANKGTLDLGAFLEMVNKLKK
jgi:hypothetical protein